jgi:hypothetical protein
VTWPMRYSIFEVTTDQFSYNTYDVPCEPEVWNQAKANSLAAPVTEWPRWSDTPNTPEGNETLEKIVLSPETMSGRLPLPR